jgi:hypothetical protein
VKDSDLGNLKNNLLPGVKALLSNRKAEVLDAMLVMLPDFLEEVGNAFPDEAEKIVLEDILPLIHTVVARASEQFAECYSSILISLRIENFRSQEIPFLKDCCRDEAVTVRLVVVSVLNYLSESMDISLWTSDFLDLIKTLGTDPAVEVRRQVTALVAIYSRYLKHNPGAQAFLHAEFDVLSRDTSPQVRKSAAEAIVTLCDSTEHSAMEYVIKPPAMELLEDPSPEVRNVMTRNLGPLITSFGKDCCKELVTKYVASLSSWDIHLVFAAAYSFPAVALTLTRARWQELESGFQNAATSREYRVRRTLAYGLACYSIVLDEKSMIIVLNSFLNDPFPEVVMGVMSCLRQLVELIQDKGQFLICVEKVTEMALSGHCWRLRLAISKQLRMCIGIFDRAVLLKIAKNLLCDETWIVRRDAAITVAELISESEMKFLIEYGHGKCASKRCAAAWVIAELERLHSGAVKLIVTLGNDAVPNVRMSAGMAAVVHAKCSSKLRDLISRLKKDADPDVRAAVCS